MNSKKRTYKPSKRQVQQSINLIPKIDKRCPGSHTNHWTHSYNGSECYECGRRIPVIGHGDNPEMYILAEHLM
jgi:hypothetical protein